MAIKNGDWLGAVVGAATALVGLGAFTAAGALAKVADVAKKVKDVATAAQASLAAAKAKNAGSLLAALAGGAGAFAGFAANSADKFAKTMQSWSDKLKKWSNIVGGGEKVVAGIKSGDPLGAVSGAFDTAAAVVGPTGKGAKNIERAQSITGFVASGKRALSASPPDYGAVASAAMGIANQLKQDRRLEDAGRIVNAANRLTQAWKNKDANPAGLADAALELATSIQVAKYDADHPAEKDADGKDKPDQSREAVLDRFSQAQRVVRAAGSAIQAVMHKPRPNYIAALDAGSQLVAELTADKRIDAAATVTARLDAYTQAVNSKNEQAILEAAIAFGQSVDGLRDSINDARAKAKKDAEAQMQPGDKLPEADAGEMPRFDTSIEVKADAPVVPLIGPGIVTELDPSELQGAGSSTRPTKPGTKPQDPQSDEPGIGAAPGEPTKPTTPATPTTPAAPAKPREVPQDVSHIMDIIKIAADVAKLGGFTIGKALVDQWEASVKEFTDAKEDPKTTSDIYEAKLKTLRFIKSSGKFIDVVSKELGKYEAQFNGETGDLKGAAMAFGRVRRNLDRFVRVAELPLAILQASDNVIILAGYKADGSGAPSSMLERAQAAEKLVVEGSQLPGELAWLGRVGARLAGKLGAESAVTAINAVKRAINAYGDDVARVVMKRVTPILEKAAARETPAIITRLGESMAAEVVKWGAGELARAASNDLIKAAFGQLATRLGFAARVTCSAPAAIAFEVAELEAHMAAEMYREAYKSISHFLSARAFGQTIDQWKNAIRSQSLSNERAADAFFNWAFGTFLSGALYEVRGGWLPYTWSNLPARAIAGSALSTYSGTRNPVAILTNIDPADLKTMIVAPALQQLMLDYLDREYQRIFHEAP
jgi:hypothetical protein